MRCELVLGHLLTSLPCCCTRSRRNPVDRLHRAFLDPGYPGKATSWSIVCRTSDRVVMSSILLLVLISVLSFLAWLLGRRRRWVLTKENWKIVSTIAALAPTPQWSAEVLERLPLGRVLWLWLHFTSLCSLHLRPKVFMFTGEQLLLRSWRTQSLWS